MSRTAITNLVFSLLVSFLSVTSEAAPKSADADSKNNSPSREIAQDVGRVKLVNLDRGSVERIHDAQLGVICYVASQAAHEGGVSMQCFKATDLKK